VKIIFSTFFHLLSFDFSRVWCPFLAVCHLANNCCSFFCYRTSAAWLECEINDHVCFCSELQRDLNIVFVWHRTGLSLFKVRKMIKHHTLTDMCFSSFLQSFCHLYDVTVYRKLPRKYVTVMMNDGVIV